MREREREIERERSDWFLQQLDIRLSSISQPGFIQRVIGVPGWEWVGKERVGVSHQAY